MAGINFGSLFPGKNRYADDGELITSGAQDYAGKYSTQVFANATATAAATATVYTVPAGKVFYLSHYNATMFKNVASSVSFYLKLNAAGAFTLIFRWFLSTAILMDQKISTGQLGMPIRCIAGTTVDVQTDNANAICTMNIHGWLENA